MSLQSQFVWKAEQCPRAAECPNQQLFPSIQQDGPEGGVLAAAGVWDVAPSDCAPMINSIAAQSPGWELAESESCDGSDRSSGEEEKVAALSGSPQLGRFDFEQHRSPK